MAAETPTFYNIKANLSGQGMNQGDVHKALYNLTQAVIAICHNLDDDAGTLGTDYEASVGTDLATAHAKLLTPEGGPVT